MAVLSLTPLQLSRLSTNRTGFVHYDDHTVPHRDVTLPQLTLFVVWVSALVLWVLGRARRANLLPWPWPLSPGKRLSRSQILHCIVMSMSVCLSVCLSLCPLTETARPNFVKFLCTLPTAVGRSSSDGVAIRCVLTVLWMTSCVRT